MKKNTYIMEEKFYRLKKCLEIYQGDSYDFDGAWNEVKDSKEKRELFFSVCFSRGDIMNRQHKIFGKNKVSSGGSSDRNMFWMFFQWLRKTLPLQFEEFLKSGLFNEYQCFDTLFRSRVNTLGGRVIAIYDVFNDPHYREILSDYVVSIINGDDEFNKLLVAKFLTIPRLSKRKNHKKMLPQTKVVMKNKSLFLELLSDKLSWDKKFFKGYREWRKKYNGLLESVMFSSGKVNNLTKEEYFEWIEKLPAGAHQRVFTRTHKGDKWGPLKEYEDEWGRKKANLQDQLRELKLSEDASQEELEKLERAAKVNTGALSFEMIYEKFDKLDPNLINNFIENKVNLPSNALVILDSSGSMSGRPYSFGAFLAAVCLYKNPDEEGKNLIGLFDQESHWYTSINMKSSPINSLLTPTTKVTTPEKFIDPHLSFSENYKRISNFLECVYENGWCTNISSIPEGLNVAQQADPRVLDFIKRYKIWVVISDNEWNNLPSPKESIEDFMEKCQEYFGYKPHIVAIDVNIFNSNRRNYGQFEGVENITYIPSNPAMVETLLTNYSDLEKFDLYTPLLSIYKSNRYSLVREKTI